MLGVSTDKSQSSTCVDSIDPKDVTEDFRRNVYRRRFSSSDPL